MDLVQDIHCRSAHTHAPRGHGFALPSFLALQTLKSGRRLKYILEGRRQTDLQLQAEALSIVRLVFGGEEVEGGGEGEGGTRTIF